MKTPYFSVILCVYNGARTLSAALHSIRAQEERDFELIVINDGSTDDSLAIIEGHAAVDRRIRSFSSPNRGLSSSRNFALANARGRMIALMDADDIWSPQKLAVHRRFHEEDPTLDASFARIAFCPDEDGLMGGPSTVSNVPKGYLGLEDVLGENPVCASSNLVARADSFGTIGGFDPRLSHNEDQDWIVRLVASGGKLAGIDRTLLYYRTSPGGLSANLDRMRECWSGLQERYTDKVDPRRMKAIYYRFLSRRALRTGAAAGTALSYALQGVAASPRAFFNSPRRGGLTLAGAVAGLAMSPRLRARLFA
ncbi:glycosyltransferase family 2 protein [Sphingomicrobium astaxanthinifaciens]|uniref:glycosyltransferase family 2 protein n=1 Tax=Sphingomicrobium astaxanthinifaciens TaxID=1227949 RepID=UPI001FCA7CF9|nr:glycosyltransferase family A protein [Sphingomicrobium astaxanthinifaciens]MCJ7420512.1 glycosyltransferase family 2 protein [Sphingomicrobium astaxanthinifaciens]